MNINDTSLMIMKVSVLQCLHPTVNTVVFFVVSTISNIKVSLMFMKGDMLKLGSCNSYVNTHQQLYFCVVFS